MNEVKKIDDRTIEIDGKKYSLVEEQKKELWEPKKGEWYVGALGEVCHFSSRDNGRLFGNEFKTKEQAERALKQMCIHNWFIQLRNEYCPDFVEDWKDREQKKCEIYYDHEEGRWKFIDLMIAQTPTTIYFPLKNINELLRKLNNGEIVIPNFLF
jgi:hypothetical protein